MIQGKSILMVIASKDFRDEELFDTKEVLERNGGKVTVASTTLDPITGMMGGTANADILLSDANAEDYDSVVFIGGFGAQQYFNDATAQGLAKSAAGSGKLVGAICIAPSILANAGLLDGKNATAWESEGSNLTRKGANYTGDPVTTDGDFVTGSGPTAAKDFGKALVEKLSAT